MNLSEETLAKQVAFIDSIIDMLTKEKEEKGLVTILIATHRERDGQMGSGVAGAADQQAFLLTKLGSQVYPSLVATGSVEEVG